MKTTLDLGDQLLADAKTYAAQQPTSLTRLVEEASQQRLQLPASRLRGTFVLPMLQERGGLRPGIDPLRNRSLFEAAGDR